jgi:Peptide-N-glycosidase F, C terminal
MRLALPLSLFGASMAVLGFFAACSSSSGNDTSPPGGPDATATDDGGGAEADLSDADADAATSVCATLGLTSRTFVTTGTGQNRDQVAADFTLPLTDGTSWTFSAQASGCETYVFLPDIITVSQVDSASIWLHDLGALAKASPKNVQYFFVSLESTDAAAKTNTDAMQAQIAALPMSGELSADDSTYWQARMHVVSARGQTLGNWVGTVLTGWGQGGFTIDRRQVLRSVGFLSDVTRQLTDVDGSVWPFESNLAYAANEPIYMNAQSDELDTLDKENATVVSVFTGQTLSGDGYATVQLPTASAMAQFDTLEVEVTMACPDPTAIEFNSCGAWDYIAQLFLDTPDLDAGVPDAGGDDGGDGGDAGDAGVPVTETELARFITSYHRESHWVEDITPMMALLAAGGPTTLHYSYAPSWNVQPTAVTMTLRFSKQSKGYTPSTVTAIASGGTFNAMYNVGRMPVVATIPADTKHAELWMIVTGHGSDSNQCGEFCNSEHQFTVNGAANTWLVDFPMAGTESGCIAQDVDGMIPNQGGTWWYGRDGWCPGEQVTPHVWDVTAMVTPGSTATVTYEGLFGGATPPATGSGNIVLTSYLATFH